MVDIARPASVKRNKKIKQAIYAGIALVVIVVITVAVSQLNPAAPTVERSTFWVDTVKRGDMIRQIRGSGTLVPENIQWIPATTQGRVERIVLRPGAHGEPDTGILEMNASVQKPRMNESDRKPRARQEMFSAAPARACGSAFPRSRTLREGGSRDIACRRSESSSQRS